MFTLRRIAWQSCPSPIDSESPSPEIPMYDEIAIRRIRASRERRHAPVHAVEAVRLPQEVRGRLRRAADAAHLRRAMRRKLELPQRLHERRGDGVVSAAGAERRHRALVVATS